MCSGSVDEFGPEVARSRGSDPTGHEGGRIDRIARLKGQLASDHEDFERPLVSCLSIQYG
jgi:hypothetical protein